MNSRGGASGNVVGAMLPLFPVHGATLLHSGFVLLCLRVLGLNGDMTHRRRTGCPMPVVLTGGDEDDVTDIDGALLLLGCDNTSALGDDQDLVRGVLVELVA